MTMEENKELKKEMIEKVLNAYFQFRSNEPEFGGKKLVEDNKSTLDIIDDLTPMMTLGEEDVVEYLHRNGFQITSLEDGNVKWQIWCMWEGVF